MTDAELLSGLKDHNRHAVKEVYSLVRAPIISYVCNNSGTKDEADDLIQDAMMALYIKITETDFELSAALSTYVQSVARNIWLKHIDRYKNRYRPDNTI